MNKYIKIYDDKVGKEVIVFLNQIISVFPIINGCRIVTTNSHYMIDTNLSMESVEDLIKVANSF
jgi:hypothetical protein